MTKCKGCGIEIQYDNASELGYSPKKNAEYCKRCFRLSHYGVVEIDMKEGIDSEAILSKVANMDVLILWVVDLFDFEASILKSLNRHLYNKDIIMVGTKADLLPRSLGDEKLAKFIYSRLKDNNISIKDLMISGLEYDTSQVFDLVDEYYDGRDIVVLGMANVGKSTFLNSLLASDNLTASRYPGTTLDFNPIKINGYNFIDTPGLRCDNSMIMYVKQNDLKKVVTNKSVKQKVYQLKGNQSFAIDGLIRFDLYDCDKASAVMYFSEELNIHRGKCENANEYWEKHYRNQDLKLDIELKGFVKTSFVKSEDKIDLVVNGMGWLSISGQVNNIDIYHHPNIEIIKRKAIM